MNNNEKNRYGSARKATLQELKQAQILNGHGPWIGLDGTGRHHLHFPSDGSILLGCGTRSGKSASFFGMNALTDAIGFNSFWSEPRGEITAISLLASTLLGYGHFVINPSAMLGLPQHRTNIWDHLTLDSSDLMVDNQKVFLDAISDKGKDWPPPIARERGEAINLAVVERDGYTSPNAFYRELCNVEGNLDAWCELLDRMQVSRFPDVRRVAGEMMSAQQAGRDSWNAPMSELYTAFGFMKDPRIADAISANDFSLDDLLNPSRKARVSLIIPFENYGPWKTALRLTIGSAIQRKLRSPAGRLAVMIDEASQLGSGFNSIRELYTFGGGAGLVGACAWQEVSQLFKDFGHHGANEILGSAVVRIFKGIRTMDSARMVEAMVGTQTLAFDPSIDQSNARRMQRHAARKLLAGGSLMEARAELEHYTQASKHRKKMARSLITASEVLNMPNEQMVAFVSGLVSAPIFGKWKMYFEQPALAGWYLPNPYHDAERVRIKTRFGRTKWAKVIEEPVPERYAHLPQYQNGTWQYIEGYKPGI